MQGWSSEYEKAPGAEFRGPSGDASASRSRLRGLILRRRETLLELSESEEDATKEVLPGVSLVADRRDQRCLLAVA
jgi:hypothetical protein